MARRVAVGISGGIDSSVAAALLKDAGYEIYGVHLNLWSKDTTSPGNRCCSAQAADDARLICDIIGIPLYILDLREDFRRYVVDYYVTESSRGHTPNPCIICNHRLKFGLLLDYAIATLKADLLATGHYARIVRDGAGYHLLKSKHAEKDQSYFLYVLDQDRLARIIFPLGEMSKAEVKKIAEAKNLPTRNKPESQDLCFLYARHDCLSGTTGDTPGEIVDSSGRVLGRHRGIAHYTVGQRHGLNINAGQPLYVIRIDAPTNRVIVGKEDDLFGKHLIATKLNWISGKRPHSPIRVNARIRHRTPEAPATVTVNGEFARVDFDEPQRAITPGQAVVFYRGEEVLGGGIIDHVP